MTATCPECGYELDLSNYPPGAALRCPDCRVPVSRRSAAATTAEFVLPAAPAPEPIKVEESHHPVPERPAVPAPPEPIEVEESLPPAAPPPRPRPRRVPAPEPDHEPAPRPARRPKPKRKRSGWRRVGLVVAGLFGFAAVGVGGVVAWNELISSDAPPVARVTPPSVPTPPATAPVRAARTPPPNLMEDIPRTGENIIVLLKDQTIAKKVRAEKEAWVRRGTLDVFEKSAGAAAPWADKARAAMAAYAKRAPRVDRVPYGVEHQQFLAAVAAATDAGCDDPLIDYWAVHFVAPHKEAENWEKADVPGRLAGYRRVAERMPTTAYSAARRMHAAWNVWVGLRWLKTDHKADVPDAELAAADKAFWAAFAEAATLDHPHDREDVAQLAGLVIEDFHDQKADRVGGWRKIDDALTAADAPAWTRNQIEGEFLINYAWDARGAGVAGTVSRDGWKLFGERLAGARECFEEAWGLDPTRPGPAAKLITVCMGQGSTRKEMERWFLRAMEDDPDCEAACIAKREWLKPKWHGKEFDSVSFTTQCRHCENWYAGLPLLAEPPYPTDRTDDGYHRYYSYLGVWREAQSVLTEFLAVYPDDREARTRFAFVSAKARRWDEANRQFEKLGDRPWPGYFADRAEFERLREEARRRATEPYRPPGKAKDKPAEPD